MCFFCNHYVFCFFSIYFFFSFLCRWVSHHIPKRERKKKRKIRNPKSRSKSVEACLPNKCVCPRVCPTASSPKAQHWNPLLPFSLMCCTVVCPMFFLVIKAAVLYMEFWFMTGLPQESRQVFVFANSPAQ